jgi:hypothetical protein
MISVMSLGASQNARFKKKFLVFLGVVIIALSPVSQALARTLTPFDHTGTDLATSPNLTQKIADESQSPSKVSLASGFNPEVDGFQFSNWTEPFSSTTESLALLISIFGSESICRQDSLSTTCDPYPSAVTFASAMNERLADGRCEGMVVLASKLFNEKRNGLRLGNTSDLTKDQLAQEISYWWGTQILPAVSAESQRTRKLLPSELLELIGTSITSGATSSLGIYQGESGHTLLPIAMRTINGTVHIDVYDGNTPNITQTLTINTVNESWDYSARDLSGSLLMQWSGSGAGSLDVIPIATRIPQTTTSFANSK